MKTKQQWALYHAAKGFWVFRLAANAKTPRSKGWQNEATRDPATITALWSGKDAGCNIGAFTSKFGDDKALLVVDVDNKNGKCGDDTLFDLDMAGSPFPKTFENVTPTGGRHVVYRCDKPVKQGAQVLGVGLDIRSRGGYIAMAGSTIDGNAYAHNAATVSLAPDWLYAKLLLATNNKANVVKKDVVEFDPEMVAMRCERIMERAPESSQGQRNHDLYKLACELRDAGADKEQSMEYLLPWNEGLENELDYFEFESTIDSAWDHAQNNRGSMAPESFFKPVKPEDKTGISPVEEMNKEFAFVVAGGGHHILWETTDERGNFRLDHLNEQSFHKMLGHRSIEFGGKRQPLSKMWIAEEKCRRYNGLVFAPGQPTDPRFYNMWRGFAYQPITDASEIDPRWQAGLDAFREHALMNVCNGSEELFHYLMSYFAHLIQRPWEKPLVALVFKGSKGVGKNALVERVADLIAPHYTIADDRRYLTGQFNGHMESCLMLILDEAFWSGDKEAEGRLKGMITGKQHNIEHKGKEGFKVANLTRCIILGNENWLVPATHDERRFAVFNVGDGRRQDRKFFTAMRENMELGGYRLLLTYLMNYDISGLDINAAPVTEGLIDQKHASLEPFEQWYLDCLMEGSLVGSMAKGLSLTKVNTDTFRNAFAEYCRRRQIRTRLPDERQIGKTLTQVARSMKKVRVRVGGELAYEYQSESVNALRRDWEKYIGGVFAWPELEDKGELECLM